MTGEAWIIVLAFPLIAGLGVGWGLSAGRALRITALIYLVAGAVAAAETYFTI